MKPDLSHFWRYRDEHTFLVNLRLLVFGFDILLSPRFGLNRETNVWFHYNQFCLGFLALRLHVAQRWMWRRWWRREKYWPKHSWDEIERARRR